MLPRRSVHTIGFGEQPFARFAGELQAAGIGAVGVAMMQLQAGRRAENLAILQDCFDVVDLVQPSAFTLGEPGRWAAEAECLLHALDIAAEVCADVLYTTTGPAPDLGWDDAAARFAEAVAPVVAHADAIGVRLAVENTMMLRADLSFVHRLADVVDLARQANVWVCADLFSAWTERDLAGTIRAGADVFALVQLGDYVLGTLQTPGRAVPGDGVVPIARQLEALTKAGYAGPIEVELAGPRISQEGPASAGARALAAITALLDQPSGAAG
ncbi:MAG: hypothetical protein QOE97_1478 [Pseudonocardiales bacterium]|nr:hypothetical protein [Pseudonocardiales bacterium]